MSDGDETYRVAMRADAESAANTIALVAVRNRLDRIDERLEAIEDVKREVSRQKIWIEVSVRILRWGFRVASWAVIGVATWLWAHWERVQALVAGERR